MREQLAACSRRAAREQLAACLHRVVREQLCRLGDGVVLKISWRPTWTASVHNIYLFQSVLVFWERKVSDTEFL